MSRQRRTAASRLMTAAAAAEEEPLTAASATCPVCLSVLLQPVTMPCHHTLCMPCFDSTVEKAAIACPLCRTRISVWLRRARRAGSLVDERLWSRLQTEFPEKVQARLEGREADFSEGDLEPVAPRLESAPGEIRREFEKQLEAVRDEDQVLRSRSERASRELVDQLRHDTAEETRRREEQERRDAELARGVMQEQEMFLSPGRPVGSSAGDTRQRVGGGGRPRPASSSTPVHGPMDVYIGQLTPRVGGKLPVSPIQPRTASAPAAASAASAATPAPVLDATPSPTGSGKENSDPASASGGRVGSSLSSDSADSIRAELCHFKPIRTAPRTPPKRRPDGVLGAPPLIHAVARSLDRHLGRSETRQEAAVPQGPQDRSKSVQTDGEVALDAGGGGDSGEAAAGKRPADTHPADDRPAKRRPPPSTELYSDERELPFLSPPPPLPLEQEAQEQPQELDLELDLESPELLEQQREAERQLELELADRRLAERLQRELNAVPPVNRSKGSADAYSLRGDTSGHPGTPARQRRRQTGRRDRAQLSIQESLGRSSRVARTGR